MKGWPSGKQNLKYFHKLKHFFIHLNEMLSEKQPGHPLWMKPPHVKASWFHKSRNSREEAASLIRNENNSWLDSLWDISLDQHVSVVKLLENRCQQKHGWLMELIHFLRIKNSLVYFDLYLQYLEYFLIRWNCSKLILHESHGFPLTCLPLVFKKQDPPCILQLFQWQLEN